MSFATGLVLGMSVKTKNGKIIVYNGKIIGQEYRELIYYLSEGCIVNYNDYDGVYFKITGWYFRF